MFELLVLHFEGGVCVSSTGSSRASGVVTRLERNDVGAVVQRGGRAEGSAIQAQRSAGFVEDLYANVGRAASSGALQSQNAGVGAVNRGTRESDRGFGGDRGITVV